MEWYTMSVLVGGPNLTPGRDRSGCVLLPKGKHRLATPCSLNQSINCDCTVAIGNTTIAATATTTTTTTTNTYNIKTAKISSCDHLTATTLTEYPTHRSSSNRL